MLKFGEIQNVCCRMFWKPNGINGPPHFALALVASNLVARVLGIVGIFCLDLLLLGAIHGDIGK